MLVITYLSGKIIFWNLFCVCKTAFFIVFNFLFNECVYLCVCTYLSMHALYMYVCIYGCVFVCMFVCLYVCVWICFCLCVCVSMCMFARACALMGACLKWLPWTINISQWVGVFFVCLFFVRFFLIFFLCLVFVYLFFFNDGYSARFLSVPVLSGFRWKTSQPDTS